MIETYEVSETLVFWVNTDMADRPCEININHVPWKF
jgi:hypothetical protein